MRILLSESQIQHRVTELGAKIAQDYQGEPVTVLGVLTGCLIFLSDLIRQMDLPLRVGLLQASSYRGATTTPGEFTWNPDLIPDLTNRHVLLIDDIFDTGHTLQTITEEIQNRKVASVKTCVLLWKTARTVVALKPDYVGFEIPDEFVVGYGLDYN
ncbi:MAG: hypoxanthine phosphoribosyltransferase, partial [Planctomycetaceae bacterium]|nr:hypoxanthine phosphoribosyltransferase [Planctomycetaceae bacterium]